MLTPARLYIASPDAARLERMFSFDSRFLVVGGGRDRQAGLEALRLCPDLLILDSVLSGMDGREVLSVLSATPAPPRVLWLARTAFSPPEHTPDETCPYPCEDKILLETILKAAERPLPALARPWEGPRLALAESLLRRLAVPPRLKGRRDMGVAAPALALLPRPGCILPGKAVSLCGRAMRNHAPGRGTGHPNRRGKRLAARQLGGHSGPVRPDRGRG